MMRLAEKVAFITGAAGGIARSICAEFLDQGANVIATDKDLDGAREAIGGSSDRAIALSCDTTDSESVREAIQAGARHFGALHVLCAAAGGASKADAGVTDVPEEEFWRTITLDLFGTFLVGKHGIPELIRAGGGSVINMTSMCALVGTPNKDAYTAAKGGVVAMTRSMAVNYASQAIRVNAIAPGLTLTPRVLATPANPVRTAIESQHLLGACKPEDIAQAAVYLASDESRVVTGQVLRIDSGATIH